MLLILINKGEKIKRWLLVLHYKKLCYTLEVTNKWDSFLKNVILNGSALQEVKVMKSKARICTRNISAQLQKQSWNWKYKTFTYIQKSNNNLLLRV